MTATDAAVHGTALAAGVSHHDHGAGRRVRHIPVRRRQTRPRPARRSSCRLRRGTSTTSPSTRIAKSTIVTEAQPFIEIVGASAAHERDDPSDRGDRRRHRRSPRRAGHDRRRTQISAGQVLQLTQDCGAQRQPDHGGSTDRRVGRRDVPQHRRGDERVRLRASADPAGARARQPSTLPCATAIASPARKRRCRGEWSARSTARR